MKDYKLYPSLPSAPPDNPQVVYHLSVIQAKMQGLKNKEQMFKQKYEKYNKILNRLTWLNACSSGISVATGISSVATFSTFVGLPVSVALGAASMTGAIASGKWIKWIKYTTSLIIFGKDRKLLKNCKNLVGRNLRQLNNGYLDKHFGS